MDKILPYKKEFILGVKDTIPLIIGVIPFGIIFGTLAENAGLSFYGTIAFSSIVFAGSAQFIVLGLISNDSTVYISGKLLEGYLDSNNISEMLYGNQYGVKTKR